MQTILGAGGAIGTELLNELVRRRQPVRLVGRNPKQVQGVTETVSADLSDLAQTISAVAGSTIVHLLVGLKYDVKARAVAPDHEQCDRGMQASAGEAHFLRQRLHVR